jgi:hypothetical protein
LGKLKIDVKREYLNKEECLAMARRLLREGAVKGMSVKQLASEIYFHAAAFYFCEKAKYLPRLREHANIIDLDDGGDTRITRAAYAAVWKLVGQKRRRR